MKKIEYEEEKNIFNLPLPFLSWTTQERRYEIKMEIRRKEYIKLQKEEKEKKEERKENDWLIEESQQIQGLYEKIMMKLDPLDEDHVKQKREERKENTLSLINLNDFIYVKEIIEEKGENEDELLTSENEESENERSIHSETSTNEDNAENDEETFSQGELSASETEIEIEKRYVYSDTNEDETEKQIEVVQEIKRERSRSVGQKDQKSTQKQPERFHQQTISTRSSRRKNKNHNRKNSSGQQKIQISQQSSISEPIQQQPTLPQQQDDEESFESYYINQIKPYNKNDSNDLKRIAKEFNKFLATDRKNKIKANKAKIKQQMITSTTDDVSSTSINSMMKESKEEKSIDLGNKIEKDTIQSRKTNHGSKVKRMSKKRLIEIHKKEEMSGKIQQKTGEMKYSHQYQSKHDSNDGFDPILSSPDMITHQGITNEIHINGMGKINHHTSDIVPIHSQKSSSHSHDKNDCISSSLNTISTQTKSFIFIQLSDIFKSSFIIITIVICILFTTLKIWNSVLNDMM